MCEFFLFIIQLLLLVGEGGRLALCLVVAREREEKGKEEGKEKREENIFF